MNNFPFSLSLVAVHIGAHLFNFEFFMDAQLNRNTSLLTFVLSEIGDDENVSYLNPIRTNETVSCWLPGCFYIFLLNTKIMQCGLMLFVLQQCLKFPITNPLLLSDNTSGITSSCKLPFFLKGGFILTNLRKLRNFLFTDAVFSFWVRWNTSWTSSNASTVRSLHSVSV